MPVHATLDPRSSEITPEMHYLGRRAFIASAGAIGAGLIGVAGGFPSRSRRNRKRSANHSDSSPTTSRRPGKT
jgi:hypothetical protein